MAKLLIGIRFYILSFRWMIILTIFLIHIQWSQDNFYGYILLIAFNLLLTGFHFYNTKKLVWRIALLAELLILLLINHFISFEVEQLFYLYTSCLLIGMVFPRVEALLLTFAYSVIAFVMTYELYRQQGEADSLFPLYFLVGFILYLFFTHQLDNISIILKKWIIILLYTIKLHQTDTLKSLHDLTERYIQKFIMIEKCYLCMYENNSFIDDWYNQYFTRVLITKPISKSVIKSKTIKLDNYLGEQEQFTLFPIRHYRSNEILGGLLLPLEKKVQLNPFEVIMLRMLLTSFMNNWNLLLMHQHQALAVKAEVQSKLAQDIHDGLAQQLFFLSAQVFQIKNSLSRGNNTQLEKFIESMGQQTLACQNEIRNFIGQLKGERSESNIYDAIFQLVTRLTYNTPVKISVDFHGEFFEESVEMEETIYRIVEEAVNNTLKHAQAKSINVFVEATIVQWTIKIADDGIGFIHAPENHSYGLTGLRERVGHLGGHISWHSHVGGGTEIVAIIPREGLNQYA